MVKVRNLERQLRRINSLAGPKVKRAIRLGLLDAGQNIQIAAQLSITEGAVSGKHHVPSAPGEPPNNDTGVLANNIEVEATGELTVHVRSRAPYGLAQEFGSESIGLPERPYLRPATKKTKVANQNAIANRIARAVGTT